MGKYSVGDEVTIADCCLIPQIYNAGWFKVSLDPYPNIVKIVENLNQLESFVKAHPYNQPDKI